MTDRHTKCQLPALFLFTFIFVCVSVLWSCRAISAFSQSDPIKSSHTFIVDPGHGGEDCGAISCTGKYESGINLEIAIRLNDILHLLGYETKMIRTTDTSIYTEGNSIAQKKISDLKQRVRIVNETDGGILISIHQNSFGDSQYDGSQVFYANNPGSEEFAEILQMQLNCQLHASSNRRIKKATGIYLMDHINKPGILVECGFLSNPAEEQKLRSDQYQKKISCIITACAAQYAASGF